MKVIVLVKASKDSEAGKMPGEQVFREMMSFNEELVKAGVMLAGEGLHPSSKGKRMVFKGADRSFIDGPFSETQELVAGFWIWQVKSMDEAVEWARRMPNPEHADGEIEIRPVFTDADFGDALAPDVREKSDRLRAQSEGSQAGS